MESRRVPSIDLKQQVLLVRLRGIPLTTPLRCNRRIARILSLYAREQAAAAYEALAISKAIARYSASKGRQR